VSVFVIDCTTMGCEPPTDTPPMLTVTELRLLCGISWLDRWVECESGAGAARAIPGAMRCRRDALPAYAADRRAA
jgi:hypothetical protein